MPAKKKTNSARTDSSQRREPQLEVQRSDHCATPRSDKHVTAKESRRRCSSGSTSGDGSEDDEGLHLDEEEVQKVMHVLSAGLRRRSSTRASVVASLSSPGGLLGREGPSVEGAAAETGAGAATGSHSSSSLWSKVRKTTFKKSSLLANRGHGSIVRADDASAMKATPSGSNCTTFTDQQLERISFRLDGMESFSVLGALVAGFSLQLLSSVCLADFEGPYMWFMALPFSLSGVVATAGALYSTIIFALCGLYGKACLGLQKDGSYIAFITKSASYREWGFVGLLHSLRGIMLCLLCMLFLKIPTGAAVVCTVCVGVLGFFANRHIQEVMSLATEHVYG
eukprot:TRINITY_DN19094_c0_g2_i1.p1 TRINITY_DN19094_c0_g2~~TRINITY_DN19094_c0_g2_i1.p1  ORF type:complete len:339 (-),score=48.71 TRINITY_DN19094_c0_g2_i1:94-1110(-)